MHGKLTLLLAGGLLLASVSHGQEAHTRPAAPTARVVSTTLAAFAAYDARSAARVQIKLSWTGTEFLPAPGLALHSTRRIFDPSPFLAHRRLDAARGHYNGDRLTLFYDLSIDPEALRRVVRVIARDPGARAAACRTRARRFSLTILDPHPVHGRRVELLLTAADRRRLLGAMRRALAGDAPGLVVLKEYEDGRW